MERVWIVGHRPGWLRDVIHVPHEPLRGKLVTITDALRAACRHPELPERFLLVDDDFFVLQPMETVPVLHRGTLAEWTRSGRNVSAYGTNARRARQLLESWGITEPLSYELHIPLVMARDATLEASERAGTAAAGMLRSLYGNLAGIGGTEVPDVKIRDLTQVADIDWRFVSTGDMAFARGRVGEQIRDRFTEPSPWEGNPSTSSRSSRTDRTATASAGAGIR